MQDTQNDIVSPEAEMPSEPTPAVQEASAEHETSVSVATPAAVAAPAAAEPAFVQPAPEETAPAKAKKEKFVPDTSVMKVRSFMGSLFLLAIPLVNLIFIFKWAFSRHINRNQRNLGIAALLWLFIFILLFIAACIVSQTQFGFDIPAYLWSLITGNTIV